MRIKAFFLLVFLFSALPIFFGCNGEDADIDNPRVIRFWHFWAEPYQREALKELIEKFEDANDVKVKATELSWNDGKTKLLAAFNSGSAPDVLELGSDWIAQFSSSGALQELNPEEFAFQNYLEFAQKPALWNNKVYALPWTVDTRALFINNSLLKKIGWNKEITSFEEVLAAATQIRDLGPNFYGWGANGSDPHRLYKKIVPFFWSNGGEVINAENKPVINSQANVKALDFYLALAQTGIIETQRQIDALFAQGKVGFWISGSWLIEKIQNENPKLDYKVIPLPSLNGNKGISFAGGEYLAINRKSPKMAVAKAFVKFISDGMNTLEFAKKNPAAGFPADKKYYKNEWFKGQKFKSVFAEQLEYSRMTPVHPNWLDMEEAIENAVVEALYGSYNTLEALNRAQYRSAAAARQ